MTPVLQLELDELCVTPITESLMAINQLCIFLVLWVAFPLSSE